MSGVVMHKKHFQVIRLGIASEASLWDCIEIDEMS
jgi:hypothetical protein